ncbi:response regulator [Devosia nitrariae]|uniref:Thioredoxin reductase n=1 Tax=Devosia nitrariae TaxID=2071872 RepID=A0ABQ5W1S5_9HYPH|nr:response regulator [Devosia nitrariae]GLQ53865.1 fused response regulator/thioredoxin-disulfide reductase [Devosia nitrariae]
MEKPVILAVDDEPSVLAAVVRDLRRRYGGEYRVMRAASGAEALEALRELRLRNEVVALLVVDQRMPGMTGVALLAEALDVFPDARRVLLTAYADTDAAIKAINEVKLHHYLMKPWHPPEEQLYPVLDDLLDDWRANFQPVFEGVRVIGHRWSADGHRIRDFLARNLIAYQWLDIETDAEATELREIAGAAQQPLPLVVLADGTTLSQPSVATLAERLGLHTQAQWETYDLIIVGAGPAGLAAAVYGASEGLRTLLIEREAPGGQAGTSSSIENYLGFPAGLSGSDLARRAVAQARRFGTEILAPMEATGFSSSNGYHLIHLSNGSTVATQALLIATGVQYRLLDVAGAERLAGAGLFYGAAITEALNVKGQDVFIVGGGNSAGQAALYLSHYASSVTLLVRGAGLADTMSQYLIARIEEAESIHLRPHVSVAEVHGEESLEAISLRDARTGELERVPARALFVFIGAAPRTGWLNGAVQADEQGFILSGLDIERDGGKRSRGWTVPRDPFWLETSIPGVFVAGDLRHRSTKRIASAVGEGAMAVQFVHQHLRAPMHASPPEPASGAQAKQPAEAHP